jgi:hypothetical protein
MDTELERGGCSSFEFAYIDDLIVASDSWEEHIEHVAKVLRALENCNLKIHPQKSIFATNVVEYLGHNVVGQHGITMNQAKVQAIKALPNPNNVSELRSILGFLAYYRHFIPGYSSLTAPLNKLLQNNQPFTWGPEQRAAYQTLRDAMTEEGRVLRPIDRTRELILHTDWSVHGIGAVLGQKDEDGNEYLCACISRSLNKHERNYPSYKGELLALAWAVRMFRQHLHGVKFCLITDHQPLKWLMDARDLNGQYARWQMLLQEYDFQIEHRAGVKHANADVLSRFPQPHTFDDSGAQLDADLAAQCDTYTPFVNKRWVETPCNGISAYLYLNKIPMDPCEQYALSTSSRKGCIGRINVAEGSDGTSDCRTVSRHTVPATSHPRVRGTHPGYRPHSPVPGQEERDSGAGSQGEPAPKGSFPPARSSGRGEKAVSATQLPPRSQSGPEFPDANQHD